MVDYINACIDLLTKFVVVLPVFSLILFGKSLDIINNILQTVQLILNHIIYFTGKLFLEFLDRSIKIFNQGINAIVSLFSFCLNGNLATYRLNTNFISTVRFNICFRSIMHIFHTNSSGNTYIGLGRIINQNVINDDGGVVNSNIATNVNITISLDAGGWLEVGLGIIGLINNGNTCSHVKIIVPTIRSKLHIVGAGLIIGSVQVTDHFTQMLGHFLGLILVQNPV